MTPQASPRARPPLWQAVVCLGLLILLRPGIAYGQFNVYHPFPDSNAVWGMMAWCTDWNCGTYRYMQDYMAGDTAIDGTAYKIINQNVSPDYEGCTCTIPEDLGPGFLREDTVARKVYWRFPGSTSDTLLYDFTLEVGDTLGGLYGNTGLCNEAVYTVQSIDSVLVGSSYHKRINFTSIDQDPCNPTSIIEGVGATTGLTSCYVTGASFGISLRCFTVGGSLLYLAPCGGDNLACGDLPSGILGEPFTTLPLRATPNPSTGLFHLGQAAERITVFNAMGRLLFRTQGNSIDLSAWPPGVYTAVVRTAQGSGTQRLVVVR